MLVSAKDMLNAAAKGHYAVAAFNTNNLEWAASILDAAERNPVALVQGTSFDAGPSPEGVWRLVALDRLQNAAEPAVVTVK